MLSGGLGQRIQSWNIIALEVTCSLSAWTLSGLTRMASICARTIGVWISGSEPPPHSPLLASVERRQPATLRNNNSTNWSRPVIRDVVLSVIVALIMTTDEDKDIHILVHRRRSASPIADRPGITSPAWQIRDVIFAPFALRTTLRSIWSSLISAEIVLSRNFHEVRLVPALAHMKSNP